MTGSGQNLLAVMLSVSRIRWQWLLGWVGTWVLLGVFAGVTVPLKYPYEAYGKMIDSAVVVGLVLPLAYTARVLDEGPAQLVAGASRSLLWVRGCRALAALALSCGAATVAGAVLPVSASLLVADTLLLAGLMLVGVATVGVGTAWLLPMSAVLVSSAPYVLPWQANLLYRQDRVLELFVVAVATAMAGLVLYTALGADRVFRSARLRRGDGDVTPD